jgi:alkyl sulfatase BDS1-like metallo-beta-lactamase superfamily hydrolase
LHYVTSYGGENSIDANQLDLQRTVNENALRGVTFTLRPAPGANAPADQHPPLMPPANTRPAPAPNPQ